MNAYKGRDIKMRRDLQIYAIVIYLTLFIILRWVFFKKLVFFLITDLWNYKLRIQGRSCKIWTLTICSLSIKLKVKNNVKKSYPSAHKSVMYKIQVTVHVLSEMYEHFSIIIKHINIVLYVTNGFV